MLVTSHCWKNERFCRGSEKVLENVSKWLCGLRRQCLDQLEIRIRRVRDEVDGKMGPRRER